jgi:biopolymer transport protein ExbD
MAKHHMPESHGGHPNVTPLIDIVMVLIVFFMLVAKIGVNTGADSKIEIPASIRGAEIEDLGNTLVLNVQGGNGDQPFVTALVPDPQTKSPVVQELKVIDPVSRRSQLQDTLKFLRFGRDMKDGGDGDNADNPKFKVIIRGEAAMEYRFLEPVLMAAAQAGIKEVAYNTKKVEGEAVAMQ